MVVGYISLVCLFLSLPPSLFLSLPPFLFLSFTLSLSLSPSISTSLCLSFSLHLRFSLILFLLPSVPLIVNRGVTCVCVFYREGDCMTILRREDQEETQWWWARCGDKEGYIPRNLLGVSLSVCLCVCVIAVEQCFPNWGTRTPRGTQRNVGGMREKKCVLHF